MEGGYEAFIRAFWTFRGDNGEISDPEFSEEAYVDLIKGANETVGYWFDEEWTSREWHEAHSIEVTYIHPIDKEDWI